MDDWLSVVLQEYQAIRAEILASLQTQQSALAFGTATIGILAAAAANVWTHRFVPEMVFLGAIPMMPHFVLVIWMREVARLLRAGAFMLRLEERVNGHFSPQGLAPPLEWETRMREKGPPDPGRRPRDPARHPMYTWNYRAIIWLFLLLSVASICIGTYRLGATPLRAGAVALLELPFLLGTFTFVYRRWVLYVPHKGWFRKTILKHARWVLSEDVAREVDELAKEAALAGQGQAAAP